MQNDSRLYCLKNKTKQKRNRDIKKKPSKWFNWKIMINSIERREKKNRMVSSRAFMYFAFKSIGLFPDACKSDWAKRRPLNEKAQRKSYGKREDKSTKSNRNDETFGRRVGKSWLVTMWRHRSCRWWWSGWWCTLLVSTKMRRTFYWLRWRRWMVTTNDRRATTKW